MLILNIGLATVHGGKLDPRAAFVAVAGRTAGAIHCGVREVDGHEDTLVIVVNALTTDALYRLSEQFAQDCIAVYDTCTRMGRLVGPKAQAWGPFNPEYFRMPDGFSLAGQA